MGGENIGTLQTLLDHKEIRMTQRYSHLSPQHFQSAVKILDKMMAPRDGEAE